MSWNRRATLYFLLLTLGLFAPCLWGEVFLPAGFLYRTPLWYNPNVPLQSFDLFDAVIAFYPYQSLLSESLSRGEFPLWNPYNFGGHPIAFNGQSGYFYPPRLLLHGLFPAWLAYNLSLALHTFLAGLGTWYLARKLKLAPWASLLAGTAWMLNPFFIWWLECDHVSAALTPLALLAVLRCRKDWTGAGALGLCMALILVAGHLQTALYTTATVILVGLVLLYRERMTGLIWARLGVAAGLTGLLSAPLLLPAAHYLSSSQRPTLTLDFLMGVYRQFLSKAWPQLFSPEALGDGNSFALRIIEGAGEFIQPELMCYFGAVTLALALSELCHPGVGRRLMILALVATFLPATPLYAAVQLVPGFEHIISTRSLQIVHFLVVLAAAYGADRVIREPQKLRATKVTSALLAVPALAWALYATSRTPLQVLPELLQKSLVRLPKRELFLDDSSFLSAVQKGFQDLYSWTNPAVLLPLLCFLALPLLLHVVKRPGPCLVGLLLADLFVFAKLTLPHHPHGALYADTANLQLLRTAGPYRVMGVGSVKPNTLLPYQIADIAGYDSFYPRDTSDYLAFLMRGEYLPEQQLPAQVFPIKRYQSPLVDLMGVKYLAAYPGQSLPGKILVQDAPLPIFENPSSLPRAFLVSSFRVMGNGEALRAIEKGEVDPRSTAILSEPPGLELPASQAEGRVRLLQYGNNGVRLQVESETPALLIFTDGYADGWEAQVDGVSAPLLRADVMFRAVPVPQGKSEVTMTFRPVNFQLGLALGALGLFLSLALLVGSQRREDENQAE